VIKRNRNGGERVNVNSAMHQLPRHLEWIHILHSDDIAKPHWMKTMVRHIEQARPTVASICSSWDNLLDDGSLETGENDPMKPSVYVEGSPESIRSTLQRGCWWHISGCAIRLEAFRDIGGFAEHLPQTGDWQWLLRCLRAGWAINYVPQTLIVYRQHSQSISSSSFRDHRDVTESFEIIKSFAGYLTFPDVYRLHWTRARALTSRLGRSLLNRNLDRARKALVLLLRIPARIGDTLASRNAVEAEITGRQSR
jgi:GT2 family glycosyltransferase